MKLINADKLIAEIERMKKHSQESKMEFVDIGYTQNAFAEDCRIISFDKILSFINSLQQEQPVEIKVVYPDNPKRKEIGFYYNKKEVSWEDMLLADRMHDYPYYFHDGMDYYPFMLDQKPAECGEDERIRKALIDIIDVVDETYLEYYLPIPEPRNKMIAYLEKQKEPLTHTESYMKGFSDGVEARREVEWVPAEWSEEDEKMMQYVIGSIDTNISDSNFKRIRIWFESIKDRVQPKQEWREEDEKMLKDTIRAIHLAYPYALDDENPRKKNIDWLKSLKDKVQSTSHWKPSEEQMDALLKLEETYVLEHEKTQETAHLYVVIKSLREQLLKIRKGEL